MALQHLQETTLVGGDGGDRTDDPLHSLTLNYRHPRQPSESAAE
jgi:hypothetical protein